MTDANKSIHLVSDTQCKFAQIINWIHIRISSNRLFLFSELAFLWWSISEAFQSKAMFVRMVQVCMSWRNYSMLSLEVFHSLRCICWNCNNSSLASGAAILKTAISFLQTYFNRLNRIVEIDIAMLYEYLQKKWWKGNNPAVFNDEFFSFDFHCNGSAVILGWTPPMQRVSIVASDRFSQQSLWRTFGAFVFEYNTKF